jgi:AhpD family alkylhydroperoxidase
MGDRVDYKAASPHAFKAMAGLQAAVNHGGLEPALLELIKVRASQINGCAFCIDMHWREGREKGLTDERLYMLNAWREAPVYNARERAALAWTDAVTLVTEGHVPDAVYQQALAEFGAEGLANLTLAVVAINGWNRFGVAFRLPPVGAQGARP